MISPDEMRQMAPSLLLTALTAWAGWRILKENMGNRFVAIGILAFVLFFSGIWMSFSLSETAIKVFFIAGFLCALIAFVFFFLRIASRSRRGEKKNEGVTSLRTTGQKRWTLVAFLGGLEVLLMYLTGRFGQGAQTGWFMVVSLLWFFNTWALAGAIIAQFVPRKTG